MTPEMALVKVKLLDRFSTTDEMHQFLTEAMRSLSRDVKKKPNYAETDMLDENGDVVRIKYRCCPVCGKEIVNLGNGWICSNANCRQAIDYEWEG